MIRRTYIQQKVLEVYRMFPQLDFPFDIFSAISKMKNCRFISYQDCMKVTGYTLEDVMGFCQSKSGCTRYDVKYDRYVIYCNLADDIPVGRKLWTAAHELGHVKLEHLTDETLAQIAENNLDKASCSATFEREADLFAATILAPFPLFGEFDVRTDSDVRDIFSLSIEASKIRIEEYYKWKRNHVKTAWENDLLRLYRYGNHSPVEGCVGEAKSYVSSSAWVSAPRFYEIGDFADDYPEFPPHLFDNSNTPTSLQE